MPRAFDFDPKVCYSAVYEADRYLCCGKMSSRGYVATSLCDLEKGNRPDSGPSPTMYVTKIHSRQPQGVRSRLLYQNLNLLREVSVSDYCVPSFS